MTAKETLKQVGCILAGFPFSVLVLEWISALDRRQWPVGHPWYFIGIHSHFVMRFLDLMVVCIESLVPFIFGGLLSGLISRRLWINPLLIFVCSITLTGAKFGRLFLSDFSWVDAADSLSNSAYFLALSTSTMIGVYIGIRLGKRNLSPAG